MANMNPFPARFPGNCVRCHAAISVGEMIVLRNRPYPKAPFHAACLGIVAGAPQEQQHVAQEQEQEQEQEQQTPAAGSIDAMIDARIDARLKGFEPDAAIDESTVRRIVGEVAGGRVTVEIKRPDGVKIERDGAHFLYPRLLRLLGAGIPVYAHGPAGSGKTTAMLQAAKDLGMDGEIDTLDRTTPKSGVLGYRTPTGEPVETAFTRCYGQGHVYIADECDNAPAHVQTLFNSALANGHAPAAWGLVERSERFAFGGTGNTAFRPTPAFPDRLPGSAAFTDRLYFIYWPIDPAIECRAAGIPVPPPPTRVERTCSPAAWVGWVRNLRSWAEQNAPTLMITPRASLLGLQALAVGETPEEVAHGLIFRGADKALCDKALAAVPLP